MKTWIIISAVALALPSGGALAQSVIEMPANKSAATERRAEAPDRDAPSSERTERKSQWRMDRSRDAASPPEADERPAPRQGSRFHIATGRSTVDLTCPDNESLRACADVLMDVIDRMQSRGERMPPRDEGYSGQSLRNSEPRDGAPRTESPADDADTPPRSRYPG
jgi:hypothetical protein